jgi:hypothetical protein
MEDTLFFILISHEAFQEMRQEISPDLLHNGNVFLVHLEEKYIENLKFPFNTQVYSFYEENGKIDIKEHYNIASQKQIVQNIGYWRNFEMSITNDSLIERR